MYVIFANSLTNFGRNKDGNGHENASFCVYFLEFN